MKKDLRPEADMADRTRAWYRFSDGAVKLRLAQEGSPTPTCTKGCSACCTLLVLNTLPEGIALSTLLHEPRHAQLLAEVKAALPARLAALRDNAVAVDEWFQRREPCLLLSKKGECRAYEARPVACRVYYVATDPTWCGDRAVRAVGVLDMEDERRASLRAMRKVLDAESLDFAIAPLPVTLAWAFKLHVLGFREWRAWLDRLPATDVLSPEFWRRWQESDATRGDAANQARWDKRARKLAARGIDPAGMTPEQMAEALAQVKEDDGG